MHLDDVRLDSMKRVASAVGEGALLSPRAPLPGDDVMHFDDVRLDSMKRVASAVGEGALLYLVHRYPATM